jgi:hypothetical protein
MMNLDVLMKKKRKRQAPVANISEMQEMQGRVQV